MDANTRFLLLTAGISVAHLFLGLAVGFWLKERRVAATFSEAHTRQILDQVQMLLTDTAGNVSDHSSRLEEINQSLTEPSNRLPHEALLSAVTQVVSANMQLQGKLASAEQQLQDQARKMDYHLAEARVDSLTKLANRRAFDEELQRRLAELNRIQSICSLLVIDVDHFKQFNDRYGHDVGDQVLEHVAHVLETTMQEMDLVARYGGEEFGLVLPGTDLEKAKCAAERARQAVEASHFRRDALDCQVTVSVGAAQAMRNDTSAGVFKRADAALYAAKAGGRNRSYFHDGAAPHPVNPSTEPNSSESPAQEAANRREQEAVATVAEPAGKVPVADVLTGLPNRHQFSEVLRRRIADCHANRVALSVVIVYADHLDRIAAEQGQSKIDDALRQLGLVLRDAVADCGAVFRYGWEDFAVLLPYMDVQAAGEVDQLIRLQLAEASEPRLTISSGVAQLRMHNDVISLMARAENALNRSKIAGGNSVSVNRDDDEAMSPAAAMA